MTEKNIFVYKLFCRYIFQILVYLLLKNCKPPEKKSPSSFQAAPTKNWDPAKTPSFFENWVEGSTTPAERWKGGGGGGCTRRCLSRPYPFKFFKGCLPQNLLRPLLNTLSHLLYVLVLEILTINRVNRSILLNNTSLCSKVWFVWTGFFLSNTKDNFKTTFTWGIDLREELIIPNDWRIFLRRCLNPFCLLWNAWSWVWTIWMRVGR